MLRSGFQRFVNRTANAVNDALLVLPILFDSTSGNKSDVVYDIWQHQSVLEISMAHLKHLKYIERQLFCFGKGPLFDIAEFYVYRRQKKTCSEEDEVERTDKDRIKLDLYLNGERDCSQKQVVWPSSTISDCYASVFPGF
jgi:hypothetical protein